MGSTRGGCIGQEVLDFGRILGLKFDMWFGSLGGLARKGSKLG